MNKILENIGDFYTRSFARTKIYASGALVCLATAGTIEAIAGPNEATNASLGYAGGLLILGTATGVYEGMQQHQQNKQNSDKQL